MKALITGASSGIGLDIARYLAPKGYELILVARSKEKLEYIQSKMPTKTTIVVMDLSNEQKVKELCVLMKNEDIDMLVNNAGFGNFGEFSETELSKDMEMINTNIKAVHILTKFASSAGFMPGGPLLSTYYATKSYVLSLTEAINYELHKKLSNVIFSALCPGPVDTNFNNVANVTFKTKALSSKFVAKYAIDEILENKKLIIIPGRKMKLAKFFSRFLSDKALLRITYKIQRKKLTK